MRDSNPRPTACKAVLALFPPFSEIRQSSNFVRKPLGQNCIQTVQNFPPMPRFAAVIQNTSVQISVQNQLPTCFGGRPRPPGCQALAPIRARFWATCLAVQASQRALPSAGSPHCTQRPSARIRARQAVCLEVDLIAFPSGIGCAVARCTRLRTHYTGWTRLQFLRNQRNSLHRVSAAYVVADKQAGQI